MVHMAQSGNIGVCSLCEDWQILSEKTEFGSVINLIFIFTAGRTSQYFLPKQWSAIIYQSCSSSKSCKKRGGGKVASLFTASLL